MMGCGELKSLVCHVKWGGQGINMNSILPIISLCSRDLKKHTGTVFQVSPDKRSRAFSEILSMKWKLDWRYASCDTLNSSSLMAQPMVPFIQLLPTPEFEEKLGEVWLDPRKVKIHQDRSECKVSLCESSTVLTGSNCWKGDLISENSAIQIKYFSSFKCITVEVEILLIKRTLHVIREVDVHPPSGFHNFGALLASSESESKEKFCDVTLTCAADVQIEDCDPPLQVSFYAHRAVLAARSPVFAKMFSHNMKESVTNSIDMSDIEPDVLEEFLTYLYTYDSPNIKNHADSLLDIAEKYQLPHLKSLCEQRLSYDLQIDNAAKILLLAHKYGAKQLKQNALLYIGKHSSIQQTAEWGKVKENAELLAELVKVLYEQTEPANDIIHDGDFNECV